MRMRKATLMKWLVIGALASMLPSAAAAQDCLDQVEALAAKLGVTTELPQAGPEAPAPAAPQQEPQPGQQPGSTDLSASGGVIEPPQEGADMPTYEPPEEADSDMPTAPEIQPQTPGGGATGEQPAKDVQVQSLLTAARKAAESGDNEACLARLQEATALTEGSGG